MKIAMISAASEWGHPANTPRLPYLVALSTALGNAGHDVTAYVRPDKGGTPVAPSGCRLVHLPATGFRAALVDRLRDERPDVVQLDTSAGAAAEVVADATRDLRLPLVYSLGHEPTAAPPPGVTAANHVLASHSAQVRQLRAWGTPRTHLSLIPHGVDVDHFTPDGTRASVRLPHRIIAVGSLTPASGFDTAVAALPALPAAELVIVGGPRRNDYTRRLRDYARTLGVADRLRLVGPVPRAELPTLLRSADLMVCSPREPSFRVVALEAMACGIAVVANGLGGLADTVVSDITGAQVPPRRPRALATTLSRMLAHKIICEQQGASGRDRAWARYSWAQIAMETTHAYELAITAEVPFQVRNQASTAS